MGGKSRTGTHRFTDGKSENRKPSISAEVGEKLTQTKKWINDYLNQIEKNRMLAPGIKANKKIKDGIREIGMDTAQEFLTGGHPNLLEISDKMLNIMEIDPTDTNRKNFTDIITNMTDTPHFKQLKNYGNQFTANKTPPTPPIDIDAPAGQAIKTAKSPSLKEQNAQDAGKSITEYNKELDTIENNMLDIDPSNNMTMSDKDFNDKVGNAVIANLKEMKRQGVLKGSVLTLPKKGKTAIVGDLHEGVDNLYAILQKAEKELDLANNPNNRIIFLGDIISTTKEAMGESRETIPGSLHAEAMQRVITLLQAKFPDQFFVINGNHEMLSLAADYKAKNPNWQSNNSYLENAEYLGSHALLGITNADLFAERTANSPLIIKIGDKSKGEKVTVIQHSPGNTAQPSIDELEQSDSVLDQLDKYNPVYLGGEYDEASLKALNAKLKSDKIVFGHIGPKTMKSGRKVPPPISGTGTIGEMAGGGYYIDSQVNPDPTTNISDSGFAIFDFDNDTVQYHNLGDVRQTYQQPEVAKKMKKIVKRTP